jgi:hypothetical protein
MFIPEWWPLVVTRLRARRCGRCRGQWAVAATAAIGPLADASGVRALPAVGV